MNGSTTRFLGDSPVRVLIKLIVVSLLVGFVMSVFGWTPFDIYDAIRDAALELWYTGFAAFDRFIGYILIGAMVVVPAFILIRILSYRR